MKRTSLSLLILSLPLFWSACSSSNETLKTSTPPDGTVGIVGGNYVSFEELKDNYVSGSLDKEYSEEDLVDFLPIYLDYRGKLLDARAIGYYNDERIKSEYDLYAKQAAYAFWMDEEIRPTKFNAFKERYDFELKSKHVLIALAPNASPEDTLEVYNRLIQAREEFANGTSLEELDAKYSTSRNGRSMGGDLPWFFVGTTVAEFEDALYSLEIDELSMPVRTQFGYHIIYLEEKRERKPSRQVSHIFARKNSENNRLEEAYTRLINGANWANIVRSFSEDTPSIQNNGYIGWVNYGDRYSAEFIDTVMNIDPDLSFTPPIETNYGYHIFRIDSVRTFETDEQRDDYIMQILEESDSFQENNSFVIDYLNDKYQAKSELDNIVKFETYLAQLDTSTYNDIVLPDSISEMSVYSISALDFNVGDFHNYLQESRGNQTNLQFNRSWFDRFKEAKVDENLTAITLQEYPEFSELTKSYQDGLVVYQVNEDSVWSTATIDTTILMNRYVDNVNDFQYPQRYHYYLITSSRDSSLDRAMEFVSQGGSPDSLFVRGYRVGVTIDSTGIFQGEPFTLLSEMEAGSISDRFDYSGRKGHFVLIDILPERTMTFDEAFNRLASEYQPIREEKWLNRIRNEYNIQAFPEVVRAQFVNEESQE